MITHCIVSLTRRMCSLSSVKANVTPPKTKVEIFYDVVSPYTWLAFETLCRYRSHWKMDLVLRPVFLGGIMKESGNRPPMTVPAKGVYMQKDLDRNAIYFGIPLKMMANPFETLAGKGSLRAQRFITAVQMNYPYYLEEVSRQLWKRIWTREEDIVEDESLREAARNAKMSDSQIDKCIQLIDDAAVKESLKKATEEAIDHGAFGAPTIIVHTKSGPEMFFGADRFPLIAMIMNEEWKGPQPGVNSKL